MIPGKKYSPDDFLRIAWRRKWLIVLPFLVISVGTYLIVKQLPNRYRSETMILVVPQRVPDSYVHSTVTAPIGDRLRSISEQILSRSRLERIIQDFNLYVDERKTRPMQDVLEQMRTDIVVETVKGDSFTISYTSGNARVAQQVTERLASMFIEENLRDRVVLADGTSQFLESQLDDARVRLIAHEKKLEAYRERFAGELPSQLETNLQVVQNSEMRVQALGESINRDRDRKLLQERLLADLKAADIVVPGPASAAAGATTPELLQAARASLVDLELRLKPEHPDVVRAKRTVQELDRKVTAESLQRRTAIDPPAAVRLTPAEAAQRNRIRELELEIENLNKQIAGKEDEQRRLSDVIANHQRRIAAVPTHESELTELMRDYETLQRSYTSLLSRKEESRTAADLERRQIGEQFKILDPAREPEKPISPNRIQLDLMGAIFGLAVGLGLTALLEYRDSSLKTEDDVVQALMLPVLALIPLMTTAGEVRTKSRRRALVLSCVAAGVVLVSAAAAWKLDLISLVR
jgi:polysaccharide chain length determinant protein (PEP-CTERM system associated)